jgi:hypothetical protein
MALGILLAVRRIRLFRVYIKNLWWRVHPAPPPHQMKNPPQCVGLRWCAERFARHGGGYPMRGERLRFLVSRTDGGRGEIRTLKPFRAPGPKPGAYASSATRPPSVRGICTRLLPLLLDSATLALRLRLRRIAIRIKGRRRGSLLDAVCFLG